MDESILLRSDAGGISTLTLNRPKRRNALSGALVQALLDAFAELATDHTVRAVVLTGAGRGFCAGGDLADGLGAQQGFVDAHRGRGQFAELLAAMVEHPKPIIAAVNGHALGGGFGLAMAADLIVLDPSAAMGTPEVGVGLFPMVILAVLQRRIPPRLLRELVLTGDRLTAEQAQAHGLVNRVCEPGESLAMATQLAEHIATRSPTALSMGKQAMAVVDAQPLREGLAYLHQALTLNLLTEDAAEGISAFVSKRTPIFRGR